MIYFRRVRMPAIGVARSRGAIAQLFAVVPLCLVGVLACNDASTAPGLDPLDIRAPAKNYVSMYFGPNNVVGVETTPLDVWWSLHSLFMKVAEGMGTQWFWEPIAADEVRVWDYYNPWGYAEVVVWFEDGSSGGGGGPPPGPYEHGGIAMDCNATTVTRGGSIACTAHFTSSGSGTVINGWSFQPTDSVYNLSTVYRSDNQSDTTWGGEMAVSGILKVTGIYGGWQGVWATAKITVLSRADWTNRQPNYNIHEIASALPTHPHQDSDLGRTAFIFDLPSASYSIIADGGPNHDLTYMVDMYTEKVPVEVNRQALQSGTPFVLAHPTVQGTYCSQSRVQSLGADIARHEGLGRELNSHTWLYEKKLEGFSDVGPTVEKALGYLGIDMTKLRDQQLAPRRDAAYTHSLLADTPAYNNFQLPCSLNYNYTP